MLVAALYATNTLDRKALSRNLFLYSPLACPWINPRPCRCDDRPRLRVAPHGCCCRVLPSARLRCPRPEPYLQTRGSARSFAPLASEVARLSSAAASTEATSPTKRGPGGIARAHALRVSAQQLLISDMLFHETTASASGSVSKASSSAICVARLSARRLRCRRAARTASDRPSECQRHRDRPQDARTGSAGVRRAG